jgi:hypothetical protein
LARIDERADLSNSNAKDVRGFERGQDGGELREVCGGDAQPVIRPGRVTIRLEAFHHRVLVLASRCVAIGLQGVRHAFGAAAAQERRGQQVRTPRQAYERVREDQDDRGTKNRAGGLLPVIPSLDATLRIHKDVGDVLGVNSAAAKASASTKPVVLVLLVISKSLSTRVRLDERPPGGVPPDRDDTPNQRAGIRWHRHDRELSA